MSETGKPKNNLSGNAYQSIFQASDRAAGTELSFSQALKDVSKDELALALTVLLVDVASADGDFKQTEYEVISSGLHRLFGTGKDQVQRFVNQAQQILGSLRGTSKYSDLLKTNLDDADRKLVFSVIQELIEADGQEDPFEVYLRSKLAKALDISFE